MTDDGLIEMGDTDNGRQPFADRIAKAREVWALHPDKTSMNDAQRLKLILVLIDLQMSYVIGVGPDGGDRSSGHYIAYLCMLLSVAATGFRSKLYPDILDPEMLQDFGPSMVAGD